MRRARTFLSTVDWLGWSSFQLLSKCLKCPRRSFRTKLRNFQRDLRMERAQGLRQCRIEDYYFSAQDF